MEIAAQGYAGIKVVRLDWSKVRATFPKILAFGLRQKPTVLQGPSHHNRSVVRW